MIIYIEIIYITTPFIPWLTISMLIDILFAHFFLERWGMIVRGIPPSELGGMHPPTPRNLRPCTQPPQRGMPPN